MTVVYDGGGGIVASLGLEGTAPRHEGHGDKALLHGQLEAVLDDFEAGFLTYTEFGKLCEEAAKEYTGLWA